MAKNETGKEGKLTKRFSANVSVSPLAVLSNAALAIQGARVALQVRQTHLAKNRKGCPDTDEVLKWLADLEKKVKGRLTDRLSSHPAYPWVIRVKGAGESQLISKVIGEIMSFARFYEQGDPMIPPGNHQTITVDTPVEGENKEAEIIQKQMVWVEAIDRLRNPSKLWKLAGQAPGQKREKGKKLGFDCELRTLLFILGGSFLKAQGKYAGYYARAKQELEARLLAEGKKIIPTPKGRFCAVCQKDVVVKAARFCPDCNGELALKKEPEGVIFQGHVHMMAQRKMIKLFLLHLWLVWRRNLGLPVTLPYSLQPRSDKHSVSISYEEMKRKVEELKARGVKSDDLILPEEMCDREAEPSK